MRKVLLVTVLVLGVVACDRATAPNRSMTGTAPRPGDFIIRPEGYQWPDSVTPGDTIRVPFEIGDGRDQCSFSSSAVIYESRVMYFSSWGVDNPGSSCTPPMFMFVAEGKGWADYYKRWGSSDTDTLPDPLVYRLVVCHPDGSYRRSDVVVAVPWPTKDTVRFSRSDSVHKRDAAYCGNWTRPPSVWSRFIR